MTQKELRDDMLYQAGISAVKTMLDQGLITEEEYADINAILLQSYRPYLGSLLSENTCYSPRLE